MFCSEGTHQPYSVGMVTTTIRKISGEAGVQASPHTLRHTFATMLLEGYGDIRIVQDTLGHASLQTTQVYTKVRPERMRAAVVGLSI